MGDLGYGIIPVPIPFSRDGDSVVIERNQGDRVEMIDNLLELIVFFRADNAGSLFESLVHFDGVVLGVQDQGAVRLVVSHSVTSFFPSSWLCRFYFRGACVPRCVYIVTSRRE